MKNLLVLLCLLCSTTLFARQTPAEYVGAFIKENAPCVPSFYCYEYDFGVSGSDLIITTTRYNYEEDTDKKVLTEKTIFTIPAKEIKKISYWLFDGTEIYIETQHNVIEKTGTGTEEMTNLVVLDFHGPALTDSEKSGFRTQMEALLSQIK